MLSRAETASSRFIVLQVARHAWCDTANISNIIRICVEVGGEEEAEIGQKCRVGENLKASPQRRVVGYGCIRQSDKRWTSTQAAR